MRTITLQKEWIIGQMYNIYLYIATFIKDLLYQISKMHRYSYNVLIGYFEAMGNDSPYGKPIARDSWPLTVDY